MSDKWYGPSFQALKDCTTSVAKGEVVVVCGPSGSGKSTLIKCVNALEPFQNGEIILDGIRVNDPKTNIDGTNTTCRPWCASASKPKVRRSTSRTRAPSVNPELAQHEEHLLGRERLAARAPHQVVLDDPRGEGTSMWRGTTWKTPGPRKIARSGPTASMALRILRLVPASPAGARRRNR